MKFVLIILIILPLAAGAQFKTATIGIDGLTCSMCSYGVERSIGKLKFVDKVKVDLNTNIAIIEFKADVKTDIRQLMKSVTDAGFTVRTLTAGFYFDNSITIAQSSFHFEDYIYVWLAGENEKKPEGLINLQFIEKTFSDSKVYKKYKSAIEKLSPDNFTNRSYYFVVI